MQLVQCSNVVGNVLDDMERDRQIDAVRIEDVGQALPIAREVSDVRRRLLGRDAGGKQLDADQFPASLGQVRGCFGFRGPDLERN